MADEVKSRFGIEPELIKGRDGVFEVTLDGELIFSKKALARFPDADEVESVVAVHLSE